MKVRPNINQRIRAQELRVVSDSGENLGVLSREEALKQAEERGLDIIEIAPTAKPPVAKIMDYGKFQYEQKRKDKISKTKAHNTETKSVQIKITTSEHDLELKAKKASQWLKEGDRIKIDLMLPGRSRYLDTKFLDERLQRFLNLITMDYTIADHTKKSPKGLSMVIAKKGSSKSQR